MANGKRLIDPNALKSCLCKCCNILHSGEPCEPSECNVMDFIDSQSTIDAVEVVHGRWEFEKNPYLRDTWLYRCTACDGRYGDNPRYCPNCGAKMDGDGNG